MPTKTKDKPKFVLAKMPKASTKTKDKPEPAKTKKKRLADSAPMKTFDEKKPRKPRLKTETKHLLGLDKPKIKRLSVGDVLNPKKQTTKVGRAETASTEKNCMHCALFTRCKDDNAGHNYLCSKFTRKGQAIDLEDFAPKKTKRQALASEYTDESSDSYDIEKMIDSIVSSETGIPRDLKVDDRDLPRAENYHQFLTDPRFLDFKPWAKQLQIGLNFFTDFCHNPKCSDVKYMLDVPVDASIDEVLSKCTLFQHGVCPKCKETRYDAWTQRGAGRYNELAGCAGQRSAKSVSTGLMFGYHKHRYLCLPNPPKVYGLLPNTIIHSTVTATTYKQAKETLYDPIMELIGMSPWFKEYHALLDDYGNRYGEELYKIRTEFLQYRHKNFMFYAAAPDKKNLRGRTRIGAAIDEIGWMFAKSEDSIKLDPNEVYTAVKNSLFTIRSANERLFEQAHFNIPQTIFCNVSSPSSANDKIMSLVKEAQNNKNIYAFHYSVFEMNPTIKPKDLEDIERANPDNFKRDFLAIPPNATNAFIRDRKALIGCIDPMTINLARVTQEESESHTGVPMVTGEVNVRKTNRVAPRLLALDAGHTFNSYAGAIMSMQEYEIDGEPVDLPTVEAVFELVPGHGYHVNHSDVYTSLIKPLIEELNVKFVAADRWQSLKLMQDIENEFEIPYTIYSMKYQDMLELRNDIYAGKIRFPRPEIKTSEAFALANNSKNYPECFIGKPVAHFFVQALTVEDILGKKVDKGYKRTDDVFRAVALGHAMLMDEEVRDNYLIETEERQGPLALGAVGSYSSAQRGAASMTTNLGVVGSFAPTGTNAASAVGGAGFTFARGRS